MRHKPMGPVRQWLSNLPFIGPMFACRWEQFAATTKEFVIIILFATATFWLSAFFLKILDAKNVLSYGQLFASTIREGQLFIFATALLGPILVVASEDPRGAKQFPDRIWLLLLLVVLATICSGGYAIMKSAAATNAHSPLPLNHQFLENAALVCAIVAAVGRYLAILYNKYRLLPEEVKASEKRFSNQFASRHANENPSDKEDPQ